MLCQKKLFFFVKREIPLLFFVNCERADLFFVKRDLYSMLPSFRTGPVFVQKELYLIVFVGHLNLRQPKNSKNKRNISAINCRFCRAF